MSQDESGVPDTQWVEAARSGDAESFRLLFEHYYDMIHAFAFRVCLNATEADDITQDTFIRAAKGISTYRGVASFKNWLYRIAHNAIIDWQRQKIRQRIKQEEFEIELDTLSQAHPPDYSEIQLALQQLPPAQREAVALVYFEDMNHGEAARILDCAETTVSWRIFLAKKSLKKILSNPKVLPL